ncbi:DUF7927 domain-containing protein [Nesterenkonia haasae]|uniref:DUF7927 domain-containing protein n=1 Tax=Nesterenkonia haasae TaxID=2587813 RepID=UPI001390D43A|nr:DUF11 domain-containing protein [Nesterenkonia haasae]NDK32356.1 DUF11 domain-containing protein [Nesterenkonia haasae]
MTALAATAAVLVSTFMGAALAADVDSAYAAPVANGDIATLADGDPEGCDYADAGSGLYAETICWLDMTEYDNDLARQPGGQPMNITLPGGYVITYNVVTNDVPGFNRKDVRAEPVPTAAQHFGGDNYTGIGGNPNLFQYELGIPNPGIQVTLQDIVVTSSDGHPIDDYKFVMVDTQNVNNGEILAWEASAPIELVDQPSPDLAFGCGDTAVGFGTTTLVCETPSGPDGEDNEGSGGHLIVGADSPTWVSQTLTGFRQQQRSGFAFGVMTSSYEFVKAVDSRASADDSFDLSITTPTGRSAAAVSTGPENDSVTTGPRNILEGGEFVFAEEGANLDAYDASWECTRNGTVDPNLPQGGVGYEAGVEVVNTGDAIRCVITNTVKPRILELVKTSDATTNTRFGDTVTYTVEGSNTGTGNFTDEYPAVVFDDLSGVLDDGALVDGSWVATVDGEAVEAPSLIGDLLAWSGPLASGETVVITYEVELAAGGDREVRNVAFPGDTPDDPPPTPPCGEDGAVCEEFDLPGLTVEKAASSTELPAVGEELSYTVTVTNVGPGDYTADAPATMSDDLSDVLDDAVVVDGSLSATVGEASIDGEELSWSGVLAAGESAEITYTVEYTGDGDQMLINVACIPDPAVEDENCASSTVPAALLDFSKSSSPSDSPLVTGSIVEYTLTFDSIGEAAADVDHLDYLAYVLDDADFLEDSLSVGEGLTAVREGDQLLITGSIPEGESREVTYQVQVRGADDRSDDRLVNHVLEAPEDPEDPEFPPPPNPEDPCEDTETSTCNPVSEISYEKSVEASTSPIEAGTELAYTVTITNSGAATGVVAREDVLTDVLDDAALTVAPVSDTESVLVGEVEDERFSISGELAAGETATVTYTVVVNAETERGNNSAANFLVTPGDTPPPPGEDEDCEECTKTDLPNIAAGKQAIIDGEVEDAGVVETGDQVTYRIGVINTGEATGSVFFADDLSGVLDDAELVDGPTVTDSEGVLAEIVDGVLLITGELGAGDEAFIEYTVEVLPEGQRGDNELANAVVKPHDPEVPGDGGVWIPHPGEDLDCNTSTLIPELVDAKSVNPASGTPVTPGQELEYTIEFENTGEATGTVNRVDDLTHVLDDADLVVEPTATGGLEVTRDGARISITGDLAAGESATVSYTVVVKDGDRGDDVIANFVLNPGEEVPEDPTGPCEETSAHGTCNPIGDIVVEKSVSEDDTVDPGDVLTYTLEFENTGAGTAEVSFVDYMADVLDDATWIGGVEATGGLSVAGPLEDQLLISGELEAGATGKVSYKVQINDYADLGDSQLVNYVVPEGYGPPPSCDETNTQCTSTTVSDPPPAPPADPSEPGTPGEPVEPGKPGGSLAITGATILGLLAAALGLLVIGGAIYMISRHRRELANLE